MAMNYISDRLIEEVRVACDIVEIISDHLPLKKSGKNFKGLCPFHSEKTPSFVVSPEKQIFHCFGCGAGGNVYQFLMKSEGISFVDAVSHLAERQGIPIPKKSGDSGENDKRKRLYEINKLAADYFHKRLLESSEGEKARGYLKKRDIDGNTINRFLLGYAPLSWDHLLRYFVKKGVPPALLEKVGLIIAKERRDGYYDRFRDRIIFPIFNTQGMVIGFGGRIIDGSDQKGPKYLNSPETAIYKKGSNLYGLNLAKDIIRKEGSALIVEGYVDLIALYRHGIENVVSVSGTALTGRQVLLLRRYTDKAVIVFDADSAGRSAAEKGYDLLLERGMKVKIIALPGGSDPDSFIRKWGRDDFLKRIQNAVSFIEYMIERIAEEMNLSSLEGQVDGVNRILPFLSRIPNSVERDSYMSTIEEKMGISSNALLMELRKASLRQRKGVDLSYVPEKVKKVVAEQSLIQLMLMDNTNIGRIREYVSKENFEDHDLGQIASVLFDLLDKNEEISPRKVIDLLLETHQKEIVSRLVIDHIEYDNVDKAVDDCIKAVKRRDIRCEISTIKQQRKEAIEMGRLEEYRILQERYIQLRQEMRS
ncbi:MAG: DNA primase [Nitrospinota bacterium]